MASSYFIAAVKAPGAPSLGAMRIAWRGGKFAGDPVAVGIVRRAMNGRTITRAGMAWAGPEIATHAIPAMALVEQVFPGAKIRQGPVGSIPPIPQRIPVKPVRHSLDTALRVFVRRYEAKKKQQQMRWVTIGADDGEGGTPVQIDGDGKIAKGPGALAGKTIGELDKGVKGTEKDRRGHNFNPDTKRFDKPKQEEKPVEKPPEKPKTEKQTTIFGTTEDVKQDPEDEAPKKPKAKSTDKQSTLWMGLDDAPGQRNFIEDQEQEDGSKPEESADEASTPRDDVSKETKKTDQEDYAFARESKVGNKGADLKGSARHKVNEWKSLQDAERDGLGDQFANRKFLEKSDPSNLLAILDEDPVRLMSVMAMHYAMRRFPAESAEKTSRGKVFKDPETEAKDRRQYVDTYKRLKGTAEHLARTALDPRDASDAFAKELRAMIHELRGTDPTRKTGGGTDVLNNTANSLINLLKATSGAKYGDQKKTHVMGQLKEFTQHLSDKYGDTPSREMFTQGAEHAKDILEGKSLPAAFGKKGTTGKAKGFKISDLYVGIASRKGGRNLGDIVSDANKATDWMVNGLKMRGVQWGNSVTDEERIHHAGKAAEAFADLADMLGLDDEDMSFSGKLGLAIGARGIANAVAHYEPDSKVINLTRKNGVGSLAHEWGHFLDHHLGSTRGNRFLSDTGSRSREFDASGKAVTVDQTTMADWQAMDGVRKQFAESGYIKRLKDELVNHINQGMMTRDKANKYWLSNTEMFARCFERHVQKKLESQGRSNTYLAGIETKAYKEGGLWPTDEEVEKMTPAFESLFQAIVKQKNEKKETYSRSGAPYRPSGSRYRWTVYGD